MHLQGKTALPEKPNDAGISPRLYAVTGMFMTKQSAACSNCTASICLLAGARPAASSSLPLLKRRLSEGFQGRAQGAVCAWNLHITTLPSCRCPATPDPNIGLHTWRLATAYMMSRFMLLISTRIPAIIHTPLVLIACACHPKTCRTALQGQLAWSSATQTPWKPMT